MTSDLANAIKFVNEYAPEHLEILTANPWEILMQVHNAGEILIGDSAPISVSNYCIGVNAILPTGRFARSFSPVGVNDFLKCSEIASLTRSGFEALRESTLQLAEYEGFPAHAMAVRKRYL